MRPYWGVFWASLISGGVLGFVAARIRLSDSALVGRRWVVVLGVVAGSVVGAVVFLGLALAAAVLDLSLGRTDPRQLFGPTLLILLFLFVGFSVRRK